MNPKLEKAIVKAAENELALQAIDMSPQGRKLTGAAFLRGALENAGCDDDRLDEIERLLARPMTDNANSAVSRLAARIREPMVTGPERKFGWCLGEDAQSEIAGLGISAFELYAFAVRRCVRSYPESFGSNTGDNDGPARHAALLERRAALAAEILAAITLDDLEILPRTQAERDNKLVRARLVGTEAYLGDDLAEALIRAELARRSRAEAA